MLSLYSRLATQAVNTALKSSVRTVYSANFLRVDTFKNYSERIRQENANNSNVIKQGIRDAVSKPDGKIFTEDLKSYLYHAETDDEINTLIDAIKKYHQQASLSLFSFNFDVPLMRLLYVQNKTDKAIDLYMKEEFFNKSANVTLLLLNKLVEEKRFDDVLKVAEKHVQDVANARAAAGTTTTTTTTTGNQGRIVSLDGLKLVSEALLLKNDASAFEQGVKFFKKVEELKIVAPARCIHQMVFLALEQNKPDVAFDMLNKIDKLNTIKANLKIMALIGMNRLEEATKQAEELLKHTQEEKKKGAISKSLLLFYPSTLDSLVKKTESNEQLKPRSQTVIDTAKQQNLVLANDIRSSLVRVIEQRRVLGDNNNRNFNRPNNRNNQQQQQQQGEQQPRRFVNNNNANNQNRQFRTFNNNNNQGQRRPQQQQQGGQDQQQQQQPQRFQNQRRA